MHKKFQIGALLMVLFAVAFNPSCSSVHAGEKKEKERLAVIGLEAKYGIEKDFAEGLSVIVRDTIHSFGEYQVMSQEDIQAVASREQILQAMGDDGSGQSLTQFGQAIGTRFMVAGSISRYGKTYTVSLRMLDTNGSNPGVVNRVSEDCKCSDDGLIDAVREVAAMLIGKQNKQTVKKEKTAEVTKRIAEEKKKIAEAEQQRQASIAEERRKTDEEKQKLVTEIEKLKIEKEQLAVRTERQRIAERSGNQIAFQDEEDKSKFPLYDGNNGSSSLQRPQSLAGSWSGFWINSLGEKASDSLFLEEYGDGKIRGIWDGKIHVAGRWVTPMTIKLHGQTPTRAYEIKGILEHNTLTFRYIAKRLDAPGFYEGTSTFTRVE